MNACESYVPLCFSQMQYVASFTSYLTRLAEYSWYSTGLDLCHSMSKLCFRFSHGHVNAVIIVYLMPFQMNKSPKSAKKFIYPAVKKSELTNSSHFEYIYMHVTIYICLFLHYHVLHIHVRVYVALNHGNYIVSRTNIIVYTYCTCIHVCIFRLEHYSPGPSAFYISSTSTLTPIATELLSPPPGAGIACKIVEILYDDCS